MVSMALFLAAVALVGAMTAHAKGTAFWLGILAVAALIVAMVLR